MFGICSFKDIAQSRFRAQVFVLQITAEVNKSSKSVQPDITLISLVLEIKNVVGFIKTCSY